MKETYIGPAGTFLKDGPYDLPKSTIKRLPKGSYKKTCAPWDRLKKKKKKVAKKKVAKKKVAKKKVAKKKVAKKKVAKKKVAKKKEPAVSKTQTKKPPRKPTSKQITTPNDKQLRPGKPGDYKTK